MSVNVKKTADKVNKLKGILKEECTNREAKLINHGVRASAVMDSFAEMVRKLRISLQTILAKKAIRLSKKAEEAKKALESVQ